MSFEAWRFATEEGKDPGGLLDSAAEQAPTRDRWACAAGCAHCCFLRVEVTEAEVERILPLVTPAIAVRVREQAARPGARRRCALLGPDDRCLVYEQRPVRCRAHVSSDVGLCESVRAEQLPSGAVPGDSWLTRVADAV
ncbi:MAG: YkgJ family cysteine cluster protein, partial [Planctomycetota bacterium]